MSVRQPVERIQLLHMPTSVRRQPKLRVLHPSATKARILPATALALHPLTATITPRSSPATSTLAAHAPAEISGQGRTAAHVYQSTKRKRSVGNALTASPTTQRVSACAASVRIAAHMQRTSSVSSRIAPATAAISGTAQRATSAKRGSASAMTAEHARAAMRTTRTARSRALSWAIAPATQLPCTEMTSLGALAHAANGWRGQQCDDCPPHALRTNDCSSCEDGYGGFPNCTRLCTIAEDCLPSHTRTVSGLAGSCLCACLNAWTGPRCDECTDRFNVSQGCAACATGYTEYPHCYRVCTDADCSDRSVQVSGNEFVGCNCTCRNQWHGPACAECEAQYDAERDCAECADGYEHYPICRPICTAANCSNHSASVSGNVANGCHCICRSQWSGAACKDCESRFDASNDCASCAAGFESYPYCLPITSTGTNTANPSGTDTNPATNPSGTGTNPATNPTGTGTNPATNPTGTGSNPATNPTGTGTNPATNPSGTGSNPATNPTGTGTNPATNPTGTGTNPATNPTGTGTNPATNPTGTGSNPATNPTGTGTNPATNPTGTGTNHPSSPTGVPVTCAPGHEHYPYCYEQCTVYHCSNHSSWVWGNVVEGCHCTCRSNWQGERCECGVGFDPQHNCTACAYGYEHYPYCYPVCTTAHCSKHASSYWGNIVEGCHCTCLDGWYGPDCSCHDPAQCETCAYGYEHYPYCYPVCTTAHCYNHTTHVWGNVVEGCHCTCLDGWYGYDCSCRDPHNCTVCPAGYEHYPYCYEQCTAYHCSNHSSWVWGNVVEGCHCTCLDGWYGYDCSCRDPHNCTVCPAGYEHYPYCYEQCTAYHCSNHSSWVWGNVVEGCHCTCRSNWQGERCECGVGFDPQHNCTACAYGYEHYPYCYPVCTTAHCSNHSSTVWGNVVEGCHCTCLDGWYGPYCTCDRPNTTNCELCPQGYENYPYCYPICTLADCSGHAERVWGNTVEGCHCTCLANWHGPDCSEGGGGGGGDGASKTPTPTPTLSLSLSSTLTQSQTPTLTLSDSDYLDKHNSADDGKIAGVSVTNFWLLIAIAVAVVMLLIILLVYRRKKKKKEEGRGARSQSKVMKSLQGITTRNFDELLAEFDSTGLPGGADPLGNDICLDEFVPRPVEVPPTMGAAAGPASAGSRRSPTVDELMADLLGGERDIILAAGCSLDELDRRGAALADVVEVVSAEPVANPHSPVRLRAAEEGLIDLDEI